MISPHEPGGAGRCRLFETVDERGFGERMPIMHETPDDDFRASGEIRPLTPAEREALMRKLGFRREPVPLPKSERRWLEIEQPKRRRQDWEGLPNPWRRFTNGIAWCLAALCVLPYLVWDHLRGMSRQDWIDLPAHLIGFTLHALIALWVGAIWLTGLACILAIPVGIIWMLGTLALRWLGW